MNLKWTADSRHCSMWLQQNAFQTRRQCRAGSEYRIIQYFTCCRNPLALETVQVSCSSVN